jgi:transcriptional regulator with XRE-family HTH domain
MLLRKLDATNGPSEVTGQPGGALEIQEQVIARRVQELRKKRRLTLEQVASKARISKSFLSKVERCNVSISIAALCRLASALEVSIGEFFDSDEPDSEVIYVPRGQGKAVTHPHANLPYHYEVLIPRRGMRLMQPTMITVEGRKAKFELRQHPGEQFILMLDGEMNYVCGGQEFTLRPGDCLYLNARTPHGPKMKRSQRARYLAVLTNAATSPAAARSSRHAKPAPSHPSIPRTQIS